MEEAAAGAAAPKARSRKEKREKREQRKSSVIIPATGARVNGGDGALMRNYTLNRNYRHDESTPLLASSVVSSQKTELSAGQRMQEAVRTSWTLATSMKGKMVLKCSFAYFLGSLATFVAPISAVLGKYDGKHMVATFSVYFHPARSAGSMHQATVFAFIAFFYSTFVSVGSMMLSVCFAKLNMIVLGHALVLIIFCGGGLGFIGYMKHVMSSPTVSVCCSMASIAIITILTKEGSVQMAVFSLGKIKQVSIIVVMAIVISNFLAFMLWPRSAISELRELMIKSTDTFSKMLSTITHSFLNGSEEELLQPEFKAASATYRTVFTSLLKNLGEAKYEHYVKGTEKEYQFEKDLVQCMQRLAQHIGGLKSAATTQFDLLRQAQKHPWAQQEPIGISGDRQESSLVDPFTPPEHEAHPFLRASAAADEGGDLDGEDGRSTHTAHNTRTQVVEPASVAIFEEFIYHLGPPMKSLAYTLKLILDDLPFGPGPKHKIQVNPEFRQSLRTAIKLFSESRIEALTTLYRSELIIRERHMEEAADVEETAASCGYFSYCLQYFAEETITFLDILYELEELQNSRPKSWEWLKFWRRWGVKKVDREEFAVSTEQRPQIKRQKTIPNVSPTARVPFSYRIWKALSGFRRENVKFSVKVGVGAALYALPAFIPQTRPTFQLWRGEWGLVSYMIVMSMTIGQTNSSGEARVVGTVIGALLALVAWVLFPVNPYALSIFGWIVSIPCFWIILNWKQATFGRFILLTYNLSALYAYSLSVSDDDDDDDEGGVNPMITDIVLHRFVAVTFGVIWGVVINRMIWPISARQRLRNGLSILWLRMSLIWKRDPLDCLVEGHSESSYMNITEEHALQKALLRLGTLGAAATHEFRLKGPFPTKEYQNILAANQAILDAFHGMSVMIAKDPKANRHEAQILEHTKKERNDLCARISHLFYVLGSSIKLGFPLPDTLPSPDRSRDRLLAKLFSYRSQLRGTEGEVDEDFALIYAYALVTARISDGLKEAIRNVELLYGVLDEEMLEI
ncbi:hypothetical protein RUND412_007347 [Rhizina undulata]